jgi:hypothetical protein
LGIVQVRKGRDCYAVVSRALKGREKEEVRGEKKEKKGEERKEEERRKRRKERRKRK